MTDNTGTSYASTRVITRTKPRKKRAKRTLGTNTVRVVPILPWSCECESCRAGEAIAVPKGLAARYGQHFYAPLSVPSDASPASE